MDPLSVSASIAGLVSLADLVFRAAFRYSTSVKGASKEVKTLLDEIRDLSVVLHNLSLVAYGLDMQPDPQNPAAAPKLHHLHECRQLLRRLEDGLPDFEGKSRLGKLQSRLMWPFSMSDTREIIQAIGRHKQTINIALAAESITKLQLYLSRQDDTSKEVQGLKEQVRKVLDIELKISLNERRQKVLHTFIKVNPRLEFENNKELRHPMTALWLTESTEFTDWLSTEKARIWCSGIPGAGKSVIAAAIIDECLQRLTFIPRAAVCYFFCTYKNPETLLPCTILSALCHQLALQHESAYKLLEGYYEELHPPHQLPGHFKLPRLIKIFHQICGVFDRVYLIIDGLDECGDNTKDTIDSLSRVSLGAANKNINIALLSRDEVGIRERLECDFHCIEIEAHTDDVQLYVVSELHRLITDGDLRLRDLTLKDEIVAKLTKGAKGMFRWVACQLNHLCDLPTDRARRKALDQLPPTLPAIYDRILSTIDAKPEASKRIVKSLLLLVSIKNSDFNSQALCEAISLQEDSDRLLEDEILDEQEVLRWCGSLVRLLPNQTGRQKRFQFAHYTVQEFLEGDCSEYPILNRYGISAKKANRHFRRLALRFLNLENFKSCPQADHEGIQQILEMRKSHPFYEIASIYWFMDTVEETDEASWNHLCALFSLEKTPNFCRWAAELVGHCLQQSRNECEFKSRSDFGMYEETGTKAISAVMRPDFSPLHMASALGLVNVCRNLLCQGSRLDFMSRYGTPLHCAIGGLYTFLDAGFRSWSTFPKSLVRRRKTIRMLLEKGAQANLRFRTPFKGSSLLALAFLSVKDIPGLDLVSDLIRHGLSVEVEDFKVIVDFYDTMCNHNDPDDIKKRSIDGGTMLNLLDALTSIQPSCAQRSSQTEQRPEVLLYDNTVRFSHKMRLGISKSVTKSTMCGNAGDYDLSTLAFSAIKNNDINFLESLPLAQRSQLGALRDLEASNFTVMHAAMKARSLECLKALLEWGFDPNVETIKGIRPIHLCENDADEDSLHVLLKYGTSTLALNHDRETIWHISVSNGSHRVLQALIGQEEQDSALQIVSGMGDTPICRALMQRDKRSVELLLRLCDKKEHWKCPQPIYRIAAAFGSAEVVQTLVDLRVEYDTIDESQGNPLHWVNPGSDVQCIEILKTLFSLEERRKSDLRTPFESLLIRVLAETKPTELDVEVAKTLLSDRIVASPELSSTVWAFLCDEVLRKVMSTDWMPSWAERLCFELLERGIARMYEDHVDRSALEPLAQAICCNTVSRLRDLANTSPKWKPLSAFGGWTWFCHTFHFISESTNHLRPMANTAVMAELLCEATIHGDQSLINLLLKLGVDCHFQVGVITPFELACLPRASMDKHVLRYFLDHVTPERLARVGSFRGLGPLHLTAGLEVWGIGQCASMDNLKYLLDAGADPNLPSSQHSPMAYHISRRSIDTAEALLDARANPWLRGSSPWDAALMAVKSGNVMFLTKLTRHSNLNEYPTEWNQTWTALDWNERRGFREANALHLAALNGEVETFEFYLDKHLLKDLNVKDGDEETPMHYAAYSGHVPAIDFLVKRGGNVNATSRSGTTPLNLAIREKHVACVKALLIHGAGRQVCCVEHSPFIDAYHSGNEAIIDLLNVYLGKSGANTSIANVKAERKMASSLAKAVANDNVDACQRLFDFGCHKDIEIAPGMTVLMFAISKKRSTNVVQWLLDNNAEVSTLQWTVEEGVQRTAFHAALMYPVFNHLIAKLVTRYLEEQGEFLASHGNPLRLALASGNSVGMVLLLEEIQNNHQEIDLDAMLNPELDSTQPRGPLHVAAKLDDLVAFRALVEAGANVEQLDYSQSSPLHIAAETNASSVAKYLLSLGVYLNREDAMCCTSILIACSNSSYQVLRLLLESGAQHDAVDTLGSNCLLVLGGLGLQHNGPPNVGAFKELIDSGIDPFVQSKLGLNAAQSTLFSEQPHYLHYMLNCYPRFLGNLSLTWAPLQTSGNIACQLLDILSFSRNLRFVRPFLGANEFLELSDLSSSERHTFFCESVIRGSAEAVRNFLAHGANVEHPCPEHGRPLVAAFTHCRLEIVKILVRRGVKIFTDELLGTRGLLAEVDTATKRWLLVERYYEQPKLEERCFQGDPAFKRRAGIATVGIKLDWNWKRKHDETLLEYAKRRQSLIRDLRGTQLKVIKLLGSNSGL